MNAARLLSVKSTDLMLADSRAARKTRTAATLAASMYAYYGSGYSVADLASNDMHEQLVGERSERGRFGRP